jgi:peptide/nickel transport system substrate-binding protein
VADARADSGALDAWKGGMAVQRRPVTGPSLRLAVLALVIALAASACGGGGGGGGGPSDQGGNPVKGGTLRIYNQNDIDFFDTALGYYTVTLALQRTFARTLYSWDINKTGDEHAIPVPDLSDGPAKVSNNNTVFAFKIRKGVRWAPPATGEVTPDDFVYAVERMYDKTNPSPGQSYSNLIKGGEEFGAGKAKTISGIVASGDTVTYTLNKPAPDFLSIVSLPFFAPVPRSYASKFKVGPDYGKHIVGNGPYTLKSYTPEKSIELIRNSNWDPATDPLRKAWVDKIEMRIGLEPDAIEQAIERGDADISLDSTPPNSALQRLTSDPQLKKRFAVEPTPCIRYFALGTNKAAGAISDVRVRQAVNYAIDKIAIQRQRGGPLSGDPASTILNPLLLGYQKYDLYPSPDNRGDPAKAKQLLAQAGFPNGITLTYVGPDSGKGDAVNTAVQASLARANIKLKIRKYAGSDVYTDSLQLTRKRTEHQIGQAAWCADYPGDGTRSFMVPLVDGRSIQPSANNNYGEFNDPAVNAKIDQALVEPDRAKRAALWAEVDRMAMQAAMWAPFLYDRTQFVWSTRVHNWKYTSWGANPELPAIWLSQ